ncbi:MAG: YigZ family protein [Candidatus Methanomethylophilaceae archaeon]|nr:YigZ family protein [Candidatus Methanomethylophilaceae archaeon]
MASGDYRTIIGEGAVETTIKGSRFIGIAMGCRDGAELADNLARIRSEHPEATHRCYAASYGGSERFSDDGEPSGTAGRPMLASLRGTGLSDSMVVVVRYFGGTLLGTGGLVHAYSETASEALSAARVATMRDCAVFMFSLPYDRYSAFEGRFRDIMARRPECTYSERVDVKAWVLADRADELLGRLDELTGGRAVPTRLPDEHVPTEESSI